MNQLFLVPKKHICYFTCYFKHYLKLLHNEINFEDFSVVREEIKNYSNSLSYMIINWFFVNKIYY